jgi:hypothetical protein
MFELELWLLVAYLVGSACGWYMSYKRAFVNATESAIDALIKQGYVKSRQNNGATEIVKWNEDFE